MFGIHIYTNGPYDVLGFVVGKNKDANLYGVVIKTAYPTTYPKWTSVRFPLYHLPEDRKPQFYIKGESL